MTEPECTQTFYSKKQNTWIVTHTGYRRIVTVNNKNVKIKDEVKLYKNHLTDCKWCEQ